MLGSLPADFVPAAKGAVPGKTLAERWILHKMNSAAREVTAALADREFSKATIIVYRYWYSELCDVYIENSKAIIREGSEEECKSAIQTLYTTLEAALTMIHPFMPFISEEMWQRMPRRPGDKTQSIMVARYPQYTAALDDAASEAAYELVLGCTKATRSLMAEYSLRADAEGKHREKPTGGWKAQRRCEGVETDIGLADRGLFFFLLVIIQAHSETALATCNQEVGSIKSLSGKAVQSMVVVGPEESRPAGCVAYPVSTSATVFLHVKGRVDVEAEIVKAQTKLDKAEASIRKQEKILADAGYQAKVSEQVQELERRRLADAKQEALSFQETIRQFERLRLE